MDGMEQGFWSHRSQASAPRPAELVCEHFVTKSMRVILLFIDSFVHYIKSMH